MKKISLGKQVLAEFYGCCIEAINNKDLIRDSTIEAAKAVFAFWLSLKSPNPNLGVLYGRW